MPTRRALLASFGLALAAPAAPAALAQDKSLPAPVKKPDEKPPVPDGLPAVTALAFSLDGKRLAVGTLGRVALYDAGTWQPVASCAKVEDFVRALAFHPDGKTLGVGSGQPGQSGRVTLWDTATDAARILSRRAADTVEALAFRADGDGLLFGANDRKACYVSHLSSGLATYMDEHNGRVLAVAISHKPGWVFVTGGMDKIVKVWDEKTQKAVVNFDQSEGGVTGLAFLNNGDQFVGGGLDGRLNWWGVNYNRKRSAYGGYHIRRLDAHPGGVLCLSRSQDGKRLATGGQDKAACVWDLEGGGRQRQFTDAGGPVYAVALSPDGKIAAAGGREGIVRLYDVEANKPLTTLTPAPLSAQVRR